MIRGNKQCGCTLDEAEKERVRSANFGFEE